MAIKYEYKNAEEMHLKNNPPIAYGISFNPMKSQANPTPVHYILTEYEFLNECLPDLHEEFGDVDFFEGFNTNYPILGFSSQPTGGLGRAFDESPLHGFRNRKELNDFFINGGVVVELTVGEDGKVHPKTNPDGSYNTIWRPIKAWVEYGNRAYLQFHDTSRTYPWCTMTDEQIEG